MVVPGCVGVRGFGVCDGWVTGLGGRYSKGGKVGSGSWVEGVGEVILTVATVRVGGSGLSVGRVVGKVVISGGIKGPALEGWQAFGSQESLHISTLQLVKTCELSGKLKALRWATLTMSPVSPDLRWNGLSSLGLRTQPSASVNWMRRADGSVTSTAECA